MALEINYNLQCQVKTAIEMAISYCKDNIESTDGWSREGLENHLKTFEDLYGSIGNSFVIADDPS